MVDSRPLLPQQAAAAPASGVSVFTQLYWLMWKNWVLTKRRWKRTLLEIMLAPALMLLLGKVSKPSLLFNPLTTSIRR
jgi:hypothetical protein